LFANLTAIFDCQFCLPIFVANFVANFVAIFLANLTANYTISL
jgi:hypothetical protein